MIYLDTNILLYATLSEVDTQSQQDKAIEIRAILSLYLLPIIFSKAPRIPTLCFSIYAKCSRSI
jgi:predicted nucleic acid-binding protein